MIARDLIGSPPGAHVANRVVVELKPVGPSVGKLLVEAMGLVTVEFLNNELLSLRFTASHQTSGTR